jgi:hypothetical protein
MIIKELKKISLSEILVMVLLIIILLQRCGGGRTPENPTAPQITRDTVWVHTDSTITKQPQIIKTITVPVEQWNTEYLPDTSSMAKLIAQYNELANKFLALNISQDSIVVDSIGKVFITDTVTTNMIKNRKLTYDFKFPIITNTITIPEPKKTQWYIGGTIQGEQGSLISQINANLLIKNKRDQMFGGYVGLNRSGAIQIGLSSFWKIKLKK